MSIIKTMGCQYGGAMSSRSEVLATFIITFNNYIYQILILFNTRFIYPYISERNDFSYEDIQRSLEADQFLDKDALLIHY